MHTLMLFMFPYQIYPSPICRSVSPLYNAAYSVRHSDYKGMLVELVGLILARSLPLGYKGLFGRACVYNPPSFAPILNIGVSLLGSIPYSVYTTDHGWGDDLLLYYPYLDHKYRDVGDKMVMPQKCITPQRDSIPAEWASSVEV